MDKVICYTVEGVEGYFEYIGGVVPSIKHCVPNPYYDNSLPLGVKSSDGCDNTRLNSKFVVSLTKKEVFGDKHVTETLIEFALTNYVRSTFFAKSGDFDCSKLQKIPVDEIIKRFYKV